MHGRTVALLVPLLLVALAGCVMPPEPVQPGPSEGEWTGTEAAPWFGYVRYVGMCGGPPCKAAVVVFEDGRVLWFTWAGHGWPQEDDTPPPSGLVLPDDRYGDAVRAALMLLDEDFDNEVVEVRTATLPPDDDAEIRDRVRQEADRAGDPGPVTYDCTDVGMPTLVVRAGRDWHVDVAPRGDQCGRNENPQEAWFRIGDQGEAIWDWIARDDWYLPANR